MRQVPLILRGSLSFVLGAMMGYVGVIVLPRLPMGVVGEELLKLLGIGTVKRIVGRVGGFEGMSVGLGFGITEAVFFLLSAWSGGSTNYVWLRLLITVPMHAATGGIAASSRYGIVMAIALHSLFNYFVK